MSRRSAAATSSHKADSIAKKITPAALYRRARGLAALPPQVRRVEEQGLAHHASVERLTATVEQLSEQVKQAQRAAETARDVASYLARHRPVRAPYRVLLLIHHIEAWYGVADVIDLMGDDPDFVPIVASLSRRFPGSDRWEHEAAIHDALVAHGVSHIRLISPDPWDDLEILRAWEPDLIIRQSQWDDDVHPAFAIENLRFARVALIPYEVANLVLTKPDGDTGRHLSVDHDLHRSAWAVFATNDLVKDNAIAQSPGLRGHQYIVTGHPKVDRLRLAAQEPRGDGPFTVLWSAHHTIGEGWSGFGTFLESAPVMIEAARAHPQWHLVFSPHPGLRTMMAAGQPPLSPEQVANFCEQWMALPNTSVADNSGDYGSLFTHSDVLVTDGLSWMMEYQLMDKPVVFIERAGHWPFTPAGELVHTGTHVVTNTPDAITTVEGLQAGTIAPRTEQQQQVVRTLFSEENAATEIVRVIRHRLGRESE